IETKTESDLNGNQLGLSSQLESETGWIDYNAGQLVDGVSMEEMSKDFFEYVLALASGKVLAKNEINGYKEISIFKDGVTL
ncbi:MAG: UxaA family hydrolase, partial [Clostridia bacterium]|nr:UxaA family hydrolase [Clostridia bacterium]